MPRKPRQDSPGIHHIYARGNDRRPIFRADADREDYLLILGRVIERMRWSCLAYCLMDNHVHLLIETYEPNLASGIQRAHSLYAQTFNDRHHRTGHVFQGRYGSKVVTTDEQLWGEIGYIVRNPVKAGLCASPELWRWSSHAAVIARAAPAWLDEGRLFDHLRPAGGDPRHRYLELTSGTRG